MSKQSSTGNWLLDVLPEKSAARVLKASRLVDLPLRAAIGRRDEPAQYAYFLTSGIVSMVFTSERGTSVELATIGREGMVGWIDLLGPLASATDCMMQVAGAGYRLPMSALRHEFDQDVELRLRILQFAQHQNILSNQIVACNRLHSAEQRFARWLLMVQDRMQSDVLQMTQEFLSQMLGTRRTTVAEISGILQRAGALETKRGTVHILSRDKLAARACECYKICNVLYQRLYKNSPGAVAAITKSRL